MVLENDEEMEMRSGRCAVAKTIKDGCKVVNQLTEVVDYSESLGFTSHGRKVR